MATYYAMTTTYPKRHGWLIFGVGRTPSEAEAEARKLLPPRADIYRQTELKNLTIKSATAAVRERFIYRDFEPREHPAWQEDEE